MNFLWRPCGSAWALPEQPRCRCIIPQWFLSLWIGDMVLLSNWILLTYIVWRWWSMFRWHDHITNEEVCQNKIRPAHVIVTKGAFVDIWPSYTLSPQNIWLCSASNMNWQVPAGKGKPYVKWMDIIDSDLSRPGKLWVTDDYGRLSCCMLAATPVWQEQWWWWRVIPQ